MSFSRPIQWYQSHTDPIWPDWVFKAGYTNQFLKWGSMWTRKLQGLTELEQDDLLERIEDDLRY
jgi:hypothetical protein